MDRRLRGLLLATFRARANGDHRDGGGDLFTPNPRLTLSAAPDAAARKANPAVTVAAAVAVNALLKNLVFTDA